MIIFGQVSWDMTGKKETKKVQRTHPNLNTPHRFKDLRMRLAVSGCVAAHSVLVNEEGKALTFGKYYSIVTHTIIITTWYYACLGRNQCGQLGVGDTTTRDNPIPVAGLDEMNIIGAACGRNHTLFLTGKIINHCVVCMYIYSVVLYTYLYRYGYCIRLR